MRASLGIGERWPGRIECQWQGDAKTKNTHGLDGITARPRVRLGWSLGLRACASERVAFGSSGRE